MITSKISVIIPVYNVGKHIEKCARSLFEQTLFSVEYIFVDDCSSDNSVDVVKTVLNDYPARKEQCVFLCLDKNSGPATARNKGLENAKGEYIYFCDADDWLDSVMLEEMLSLAEKEKADIVICDFCIVYKNQKHYCRVASWTLDKNASIRNYIRKEFNSMWNLLIRKDLYKDNNLAFIPGYKCAEDLNLSVKLFYKSKKNVNLHKVLYYYNHTNEDSIMYKMDEKSLSDERIMCKELLSWLDNEGVGKYYTNVLYWRILKGKQEWLLDTKTYDRFLTTMPESNQYIISCPYYNIKLKIMGWCLVHHMVCVSKFFLLLRHLKSRFL